MINVRIVPNNAGSALARARHLAPVRLTAAINLAVQIGKSQIELRTPVGWSHALQGNYQTEVQRPNTANPRGVILNATLYHDVVEEGRRPGKQPPVAAIIPWVGSKLGIPPGPERERVAFLVARKIGRVGFEGAHMVRDGWAAARPMVRPVFTKIGFDIVQDIR